MISIRNMHLPFAPCGVWMAIFCLPAIASDFGCSRLENDPLVASVEGKQGLAFRRFSSGQSASSAETTGPGETCATRTPCGIIWRRMPWTKLVIAHFEPE